MKVLHLVSHAIVFAAGLVVASLSFRSDTAGAPSGNQDVGASLARPKTERASMQEDEYEHQITELRAQLEAARAELRNMPGAGLPPPRTTAEIIKREGEMREERAIAAQARETSQLLAAGFTKERIDFIRRRADELLADYRRKDDQLRQQGKFDTTGMLSHNTDSDIDLRHEIGEEEYTKYRLALGRSTGMKIGEVQRGGYGEAAGLKPGDEIIAYNGARVFNIGELNAQIVKYTASGTSLTVDVLRDGQKFRVSVPPGDMRVRVPSPIVPTVNDIVRMNKESKQLEAIGR